MKLAVIDNETEVRKGVALMLQHNFLVENKDGREHEGKGILVF